MRTSGILVLLTALLFSCNSKDNKQDQSNSTESLETDEESWADYFRSYGVEGCIMIKKVTGDPHIWYYNKSRVDSAYLPASTFKIPNSLIALETGVVKDVADVFKWDGVKRMSDDWNQDLNLGEALKLSAVWVYQEIAREVGKERMQYYMDIFNYGNRNIGDKVDSFWLDGALRISTRQQISFLEKLALNKLPVSNGTMDVVDSIMVRIQTDTYTLHAKTGWAIRVQDQIGWFVGWLEEAGDIYVFATNIKMKSKDDIPARQEITTDVLKSMGLMK